MPGPAGARELLLAAVAAARPGPRPERLRDLSTADLVLATGLAGPEVELLMPTLAREYGARVAATGAGELLWRFPASLTGRRHAADAREALRSLGRVLRKGAGAAVRAAIGIGYSFWALVAFLSLGWADRGGGAYVTGRKISFYSLVFSFVLGGPDPEADRATRAGSEFLAWAAARRGLVSAAEYALRNGIRLDEAGEALALYAAEYGGCPQALGEGILAWYFPAAAGAERPPPPAPPFRRMRPFSPNPRGWNLPIALVGAVNAAAGAASVAAWARWATLAEEGRAVPALLASFATGFGIVEPAVVLCCAGLLPLATGLLGLALPLVRLLGDAAENAGRKSANARMIAGKRVLDSGGRLELPVPGAPKARGPLSRRLGSAAPRKALDSLAAELGARIDGLPDGRISYEFEALAAELRALEEARAGLPPPEGRGRIVYDSGAEDD